MTEYTMTKEECLRWLASVHTNELAISTVSSINKEWESVLPPEKRETHLYKSWMGGCTSIAFGLALALPNRRVISMDGDGSMLMDLTILPAIAHKNPANLTILVWDNSSYVSGSLEPHVKKPNMSFTDDVADLAKIAQGAGIKNAKTTWVLSEFQDAFNEAKEYKGPSFIVAKVPPGRSTLKNSPYMDGHRAKWRLMNHIEATEKVVY